MTIPPSEQKKVGRVVRVLRDYGFIACDDLADQEVYFKNAWFHGSPPLAVGDTVTFELRTYGENVQAYRLFRVGSEGGTGESAGQRPLSAPSQDEHLYEWAYLGYLPNTLAELAGLALPEGWEFKNTSQIPERPFPILLSYLIHTFQRLALERKVKVNLKGAIAAFNTGLVDNRYESIYAIFGPGEGPRGGWQFAGFCIAGEGADGQNLVRNFAPLPAPAHYFDAPTDLLYDTRAGKPELDWRHLIIERIDRYPSVFVEDHWPDDFSKKDPKTLAEAERKDYWFRLGKAIEDDKRTYRNIMNRVKDAVDLSIKRASWNFKTAIPQYYPRVKRLQLLLPMCLVSDECVDLALAVEKTASGSYLGHTVLPLDWAYMNARLICRPDSDWLAPQQIDESASEEVEDEQDDL